MVKIAFWLLFPFLKYSKKYISGVISVVKCICVIVSTAKLLLRAKCQWGTSCIVWVFYSVNHKARI